MAHGPPRPRRYSQLAAPRDAVNKVGGGAQRCQSIAVRETVMGFAALYPSYGPTMPVDPRDIENGMKPALSGWHDIRFSVFAARIFPWRSNGRSHKIPEA